MQISWLGQSCLKIQNKEVTIVANPYVPENGLKLPSLKADIVIRSQPEKDYSIVKPINPDEEVFFISAPGEYEKRGVFIYGIPFLSLKKDAYEMICQIKIDDINVGFLGEINQILSTEHLEKLNGIDILILPVGGGPVLDSKKAVEIVSAIEPRIVIPIFYKIPGLKLNLDPVDKFCKELGIKPEEPTEKLKISKKELPQEETKVIILKI